MSAAPLRWWPENHAAKAATGASVGLPAGQLKCPDSFP